MLINLSELIDNYQTNTIYIIRNAKGGENKLSETVKTVITFTELSEFLEPESVKSMFWKNNSPKTPKS